MNELLRLGLDLLTEEQLLRSYAHWTFQLIDSAGEIGYRGAPEGFRVVVSIMDELEERMPDWESRVDPYIEEVMRDHGITFFP